MAHFSSYSLPKTLDFFYCSFFLNFELIPVFLLVCLPHWMRLEKKTHKITVKWHPKSTACDLCRALCANWSPYTVFPVGSHCHFLKQLLKMFISSLPFSHLFLLPSQWIIPSDFTQKIRAITWLPHPDNTFCGVHAHTSSFFFLLPSLA